MIAKMLLISDNGFEKSAFNAADIISITHSCFLRLLFSCGSGCSCGGSCEFAHVPEREGFGDFRADGIADLFDDFAPVAGEDVVFREALRCRQLMGFQHPEPKPDVLRRDKREAIAGRYCRDRF